MTGRKTPHREIAIATLHPSDAHDLARLHGEIFPQPWGMEDFQRLLTGAGALGLTASLAGDATPGGFAIVRLIAGEAEVLTLGVRPQRRRRGLAAALVAAIGRHAAAHGCAKVFLEVAEDNRAARKLYTGQGFRRVGRRAGYFRRRDGPAIDALVLSCRTASPAPNSI